MKITYTLHSHTYRCGHASGDIEDYAKEATRLGFNILGVSDHVFLPYVSQPWMRGEYEELLGYIETYKEVKEKYKDSLHMFLAFECEYIPKYLDYYASLLKYYEFDYLLCGQHMTFDVNGQTEIYFNYSSLDNIKGIKRYRDDVVLAIKSGLFLYIAHPDLFMYTVTKITPEIVEVFNDIIDASIKYEVPLEINYSGYYRNKSDLAHGTIGYPCKEFWKIAKAKGAKMIFGGDYHSIEAMSDNYTLNKLNSLIEELDISFSDPIEEYKKYRERIEKMLKI